MVPIFLGACYVDCCAFLENPRPFQQFDDNSYCVVDATIPTADSWLDSTFAIASLSYQSQSPHTSFLPGLYNIHAKVITSFTITNTFLTVSRSSTSFQTFTNAVQLSRTVHLPSLVTYFRLVLLSFTYPS